MKPTYIYPGSFCPPTNGHLKIIRVAAELFAEQEITIVCSRNPQKVDNWFTPEECCDMWRSYELPSNVRVKTLSEFLADKIDPASLVMIRGLRNEQDAEEEKKTMLYNMTNFSVTKFFYIWSDCRDKKTSSTSARKLAQAFNVDQLGEIVSPLVVSKLLEKALQAKNVFLVVGKPGAGKSTFLKMLTELSTVNVHISVDDFNKYMKTEIAKKFPGENIYELVKRNESEMIKFIAPYWLAWIKLNLKQIPAGCNVFIEAAYGLEDNKSLYRMIGGKIIFVNCSDEKCRERIIARGTSEHLAFVDKIPSLLMAKEIASAKRLHLAVIESGDTLAELEKNAVEYNKYINT